jgi:acyl-CoA synthetase (NDP forming)
MNAVAIIGASNDRSKFGNKALRAYARRGYTVYPVNPRETEIEGLPAYRSVLAIPGPVDRASLYVPPAVGVSLLPDLARKGVGELFINPGSGGPDLLERAEELGLKVVEGCSILDIGESPGAY